MSYPTDLDEYEDREIIQEFARRAKLAEEHKCSYCGKPYGSEPICKFPHRHNPTLPWKQ